MKNLLTYAIVLTAVLLGLLASVGARAEESKGDTYNFYFQKAPGPVTVNQGGSAAAPVPVPIPSVTVATPPTEESAGPRRFFLTLGYALGNFNKSPSRYETVSGQQADFLNVPGQYAVKGEFDLTQYLALTGELFALNRKITSDTGYVIGRSADAGAVKFHLAEREIREADTHALDFAVGAALHLVRLRATTFSLLGGMATAPTRHYEFLSGSPTAGGTVAERGVDHLKELYAGARLRLLADNVWGLDLSYRTFVGGGAGLTQLGLTFAL